MSTKDIGVSGIPECYLGLVHTLAKPPLLPHRQLLNTTSTFDQRKQGGDHNLSNTYYAFGIAPVLLLSITIANSLLIWELCIDKKNKGTSSVKKISITKRLFIYHALTDLIIGSLVIPIQMTAHFQQGHIGYMCWYLSLAVSLTMFSQCTGINTLLTISFLRYLSIKRPFMVIQGWYVFLVLLLQTLFSLGVAVYTFFVYFQQSTAHEIGVNFFVLFIFISVSSFLLVLWNVKSFMMLKMQDKHLAGNATSTSGSENKSKSKSKTIDDSSCDKTKTIEKLKQQKTLPTKDNLSSTSLGVEKPINQQKTNATDNCHHLKIKTTNNSTDTATTTKMNYKARAVTTLITITISYVVCTIPYAVYSCILGTYLFSTKASLHEYFVYLERFVYIQALYLMNCALTPSIYVYRHRQQRLISKPRAKSKIIPKKSGSDRATSTQISSG